MNEQLEKIKKEVLKKVEEIKDSKALQNLEKEYMGRKGKLTALLRSLANMDAEDRKKIGKLGNDIKKELRQKFTELKSILEDNMSKAGFVDVGLPGPRLEAGHIHPISRIMRELEEVFSSLGFMVLDGPELESDFFNFTALNIPLDHPARDMQDTFYIAEPDAKQPDMVMRTHTSPMQVRAMQEYGAPLNCVVPGRVFRNEATDATHDTTFDQLEGLMIGKGISVANLSAVLREVLSKVFNQEIKTRTRPGYFPFVEPGIEFDMSCTICHGAKCPSCKHTGWLEMIGAGMAHPRVLEYGNIDPDKYTGFAFGIGITRLAMMKYGINDIRLFNSGDLRFLKQF
jgi:phenylalanyl-tRNA synthetase alpha chain